MSIPRDQPHQPSCGWSTADRVTAKGGIYVTSNARSDSVGELLKFMEA
ncbi:hypothetical protein [Streptomyces sennicomposti]